MESINPAKSYLVKEKFALNLGEGANKRSFNVSPGDIIVFDGLNVIYGGIKGEAPSLRTVISFGWIQEIVEQAVQPAGKSSAKKSAAQVIVPPPVPPAPKPVDPSWAGSRRSVSSDEYGKEVKTVRGTAATENPATVVSSSTGSTRNRAIISEEEKSVKAVRAVSGAPTPARAAEMAKTASAQPQAQSAAQPQQEQRQVQYMQPPTRVKRVVVENDEQTVAFAGSRRATPTQYVNEVSARNGAGTTDEEFVSEEFARAGKKGRGATSRAASAAGSQAIESQAPAAVIKTRRASAAPIDGGFVDMTKVSNADIQAIEKGPVVVSRPIESDEGVVVASTRNVKSYSSEAGFTSKVTVSGSGSMTVPKATTSSSGADVIMSKTASVSASDSSLYDPANYLGLKSTGAEGFSPIGVATSAKTASTAQPAQQAAPEAQEGQPSDIEFGEEGTGAPEIPMVLDHNGKLVPAAKAPTRFQSVGDTDVKEEDYSHLNDEAAPAGEPAVGSTAVASNEVVAPDFLETMQVGGVPWSKLPYQAKIQYINGKRVGNRMVGGCNNLSILSLIIGQKGLPPSVVQAATQRLGALKSR